MKHRLKIKQSGMSFISLLFVGGVLVCAGVIAAQVLPTVIEYFAIMKAVDKAKSGGTVAEIRQIYGKATDVDDTTTVSGNYYSLLINALLIYLAWSQD